MIFDVGDPGPGLRQAQKRDRVKLVNGISLNSSLVVTVTERKICNLYK